MSVNVEMIAVKVSDFQSSERGQTSTITSRWMDMH